jgi:NAD dependent epimerase/dehydratase family enzyme
MLGEGASVLTGGQRVLPRRITGERGYTFAFPVLAGALENLLA